MTGIEPETDGILALDLGTKTGFAVLKDNVIASGTRQMRNSKDSPGLRFLDFRRLLIDAIRGYGIGEILFERVYGHRGTIATHVYGGFMYMLYAVCAEYKVECRPLRVHVIKKNATGKGNATKVEVTEAMRARGFEPGDDNEADALAILYVYCRARGLQFQGPSAGPSALSEGAPGRGPGFR